MDRQQILHLLKYEPYKIGHFIGLKDLNELNNEWIRSFLYSTDDQTLQSHRGSYKTTCLGLFLSIHTITRPNENIMMFRKTDTDVAEVFRLVKNILRDPVMQKISTVLYDKPIEFNRLTSTEIHTNLSSSSKGASQIVGSGLFSSITGKHADIVITDDIVNVKDRISSSERERTKLSYMELQNIKNRGGRFINTGTPWHVEDAFTLMPNLKKYDCYSTGLISQEEIMRLRGTMSDSLFSANYELKHIADADAMFKSPNWCKTPELLNGGISHVDASYGGADGTAFTIINRLDDGRIIALGKRWNKHIDDCRSEIRLIHNYYKCGSIFNELNADKGYLAKELKKDGLLVRSYNENMNKYVKIATYLKKYWNDIYWLEDTDHEYIQEILDYTEFAEHDDSPDSIASLLRESEKSMKLQVKTFKGGI